MAGGVGVTRNVYIPFVVGINIAEWTSPPAILPKAFVAWRGLQPISKTPVGLYLVEWKNPVPEKVESIDFVSTVKDRGVPILVAVSGDK